MKIRFVHQYFHPDLSSVSRVISEIAFALADKGHEVSVICSRNKYDGVLTAALPPSERLNGVEIQRCWGPSFGRRTLAGRTLDMVSFCVLAALRSLIAPRADTIVFLTNPPLFSLIGVALKKIRRERFVYILMDVYPDIAVRDGLIQEDSIVTRILQWMARISLKGADRVVVLGEDMCRTAILSGAPPEKVVVIRNWADAENVFPVPPEENRLRKAWGLDGKFVVEYSGNLGTPHFFEDILMVAEELSVQEDIRFVFIGGGVRRKEVEKFVTLKKLSNVILLPYQEASDLPQSLSVGDIHYISLRAGFEGLVVPSKAYGIMAVGRPIIYQGLCNGEVAQMISREEIGVVISPGDRERLRDTILMFHGDKDARIRTGMLARKALEERYSASIGLSLYHSVLTGSH